MSQSPTTHDVQLERKVIGLVMLTPGLLVRMGGVSEESFSQERHARTWALLNECARAQSSLTPEALHLYDRTAVAAVGGVDTLESYRQDAAPYVTDPQPLFLRLQELHRWRQLDRIARHLALEASKQESDPEDILSRLALKAHTMLGEGRETSRSKKEVAQTALDRALQTSEVVTTGLTPLDYHLQGGLHSRRLYGIGGIYGRGKTILLGSISDNLNIQGVPHLFISMETDPEDIELRACAKHVRANASNLSDPFNEDRATLKPNVDRYIDQVPNRTWYEFCPGATMHEIHRMILRAKARNGITGFMLDYWQLIEGRERGQSEEGHHRSNINRLAAICRQHDLWGIVTAQIDEKGKLRYSDSMLQAAALYMRLARDEDGMDIRLEVEKSNYTRQTSALSASLPGMVFDAEVGPHVRDQADIDAPRLAAEALEAGDQIRL
jgi:replicative DNA helicase